MIDRVFFVQNEITEVAQIKKLKQNVDFHFVVNFKIRKMPRPSTNIFRKYFGFNLETNKSVC